jgi:pimeloyl-ACP methyl ester carboxylesterase
MDSVAATVAYFSVHLMARLFERTGMVDAAHLADLLKPSWSWGVALFMLNSYAPTMAKLIGGFHGLAALVSFTSGGKFLVHQRYLLYPALASVAAFAASLLLRLQVPGRVVALVLMFHFASIVQEVIWRMTLPAPIITQFIDVPLMQERHRASGRVEISTIPSTQAPGVNLSIAIVRGTRAAHQPPRVILYLGGNGELWENSIGGVAALARRVGADAVAANYRGVGTSGGVSRAAGDLVHDASDVISYLLRADSKLQQRDIVIFGHSIGGGVAAQIVAHRYPECGLVLDRTFSALGDTAHGMMPFIPLWLTWPVMSAVFGQMDSSVAFPLIRHDRKVVTYHRADRIISFTHAALGRLPDYQTGRFKRYTLELGGHSADAHNCDVTDLVGSDELLHRVHNFFRQ